MAYSPAALAWSTENCTVGRTMAILGERWTFVVLREVFNGVRRFDDIRRHSGIPRQVLSNRLALLVEQGVLRREPYQDPGERARHEYRLTDKGFDLYPVLVAIADWGDRYLADAKGPPVAFAHRACGAPIHAELRCADGHLVDRPRDVAPRPAAGARPFEPVG
jgi:DNA-binding HxlR family transcriptional regulator